MVSKFLLLHPFEGPHSYDYWGNTATSKKTFNTFCLIQNHRIFSCQSLQECTFHEHICIKQLMSTRSTWTYELQTEVNVTDEET